MNKTFMGAYVAPEVEVLSTVVEGGYGASIAGVILDDETELD